MFLHLCVILLTGRRGSAPPLRCRPPRQTPLDTDPPIPWAGPPGRPQPPGCRPLGRSAGCRSSVDADPPLGRHPPWMQTLPQVCQQYGGTHPTEMHPYFCIGITASTF